MEHKKLYTKFISGRVKSVPRNISLCDTGEVPGQGQVSSSSSAHPPTLSSQTVIPRLRDRIAVRMCHV